MTAATTVRANKYAGPCRYDGRGFASLHDVLHHAAGNAVRGPG